MLDLGSTLTIASPGSLTAAGFARSDARIKLTDTIIGGATDCNHMHMPHAHAWTWTWTWLFTCTCTCYMHMRSMCM